MLKCVIVYIPGSGGSFLRRALSLSDQTVFESSLQYMSADEKFQHFNNWDPLDWKTAERSHRPKFRTGSEHFYKFEETALTVIDAWHPTEFLHCDQNQACWVTGSWPKLIFLSVDIKLKEFFLQNQKTKSYYLDWHQEQQNFLLLKTLYSDRAVDINFYELCDLARFHDCICRLDHELDLQLRIDLALELWKNWYTKSQLVWIK